MLPMAEILVIDDDPDILTLLFDALSGAGHTVRTESNPDDGIASAVGIKPDLVVLDWMMPFRSGIEVCQRLRTESHLADLRVLMLSARGTEADLEGGYAAGVDSYIVKPFSPRALVWRVEAMLSQAHLPVLGTSPED
jgi:DNA-binding response OmpR family regulator